MYNEGHNTHKTSNHVEWKSENQMTRLFYVCRLIINADCKRFSKSNKNYLNLKVIRIGVWKKGFEDLLFKFGFNSCIYKIRKTWTKKLSFYI